MNFATAAEQPAFQPILQLVTQRTGRTPTPYRKRKGVFCLFLNQRDVRNLARHYADRDLTPDTAGDEATPVIECLQQEVLDAGGCLIETGYAGGESEAIMLLLFPTNDQYAVIAARGTNGKLLDMSSGRLNIQMLTCGQVVGWLRDLAQTHPFLLTSCSFEHVAGRFLRPVMDATPLARRIFAFCPDAVHQGCGSLAELAQDLETTRRFYLWWD